MYRAYEAIRRRDVDGFIREAHPDVEGALYVMEAEGAVYKGHAGLIRFLDELFAVFPNWHPDVLEVSDHGDVVVAKIRTAGRASGSGVEVEQTVWQVLGFREGKTISFRGFASEAEALEAVSQMQATR